MQRSRALRKELEGLNLNALKERMRQSEISSVKMWAAEDSSDQKSASEYEPAKLAKLAKLASPQARADDSLDLFLSTDARVFLCGLSR